MEEAENRSRTGAPTSLAIYDRGLSTTISKVNRDAYGKTLDATALLKQKIKKMEFYDKSS